MQFFPLLSHEPSVGPKKGVEIVKRNHLRSMITSFLKFSSPLLFIILLFFLLRRTQNTGYSAVIEDCLLLSTLNVCKLAHKTHKLNLLVRDGFGKIYKTKGVREEDVYSLFELEKKMANRGCRKVFGEVQLYMIHGTAWRAACCCVKFDIRHLLCYSCFQS